MPRCDRSLISSFPLRRVEQPSLSPQLGEAEPHGPAAQSHGPAESPGTAKPCRPAQPCHPATATAAPPAAGTWKQVRAAPPASASREDHRTPLRCVFVLFLAVVSHRLGGLWQGTVLWLHSQSMTGMPGWSVGLVRVWRTSLWTKV